MAKKIYATPTIEVVDMETEKIMAGSYSYQDNGTSGTVVMDGEADEAEASTARVASNKYFDGWSDDED